MKKGALPIWVIAIFILGIIILIIFLFSDFGPLAIKNMFNKTIEPLIKTVPK